MGEESDDDGRRGVGLFPPRLLACALQATVVQLTVDPRHRRNQPSVESRRMADLELQAGVLSRLIKHTAFAAGKSDERYLMTCVSFRGVKGSRGAVIEAAATDNWCLAVARGPGEGVGQVNFPAKALSRLRLTCDAEESVTIKESEGRVQVIEATRPCADEPLQAGSFPAYDDILSQAGEPTAVVSMSDARPAMREVIHRAAYVELISRDGSLTIAAAKRSAPVACHLKPRRDASLQVSGPHLARAIAHCGDGEIALYLGHSLLGAEDNFRLHLAGSRAKLFIDSALLQIRLLEPYELSHILNAVDDVLDVLAAVEHRRVYRAPIPLLEAASVALGLADVVFLDRHRVRRALAHDPIERRPQVAGTRGGRVAGVVGKNLKKTFA
ncbi:MAG TPA: hypothetical protein VGR35_01100 [Tepidisphaeraceae bacterium]|nr:hypothetical protein [Tepidisphaeraceae bacterium]